MKRGPGLEKDSPSASPFPPPLSRLPAFKTGLLLSLLMHLLLWRGAALRESWRGRESSTMEIDLTRPFRLVNDPSLARRAAVPGTGAPIVERPSSLPPAYAPAPPKPAPDWVLPGPGTQVLERPATAEAVIGSPGGTPEGTGPGLGGLGDGTGFGEVDWVYLTTLPRVLNLDELAANMRRFYPEAERRAGKEGDVTLDVHVDKAGVVRSLDVIRSAGAAFDEAARKVLRAARFSPALVGKDPVAVKVRQTIAFRLED